jgi:hypothetical protein
MPFINLKITNKSIAKEGSEFSTPAELTELKFLRSAVLDMAEFYKRRMIKYLLDHPSMFPAYNNPNALDNMPKSAQAYFTGIYIPYGHRRGNIPNWLEPYGTISPCQGCGGGNSSNPY